MPLPVRLPSRHLLPPPFGLFLLVHAPAAQPVAAPACSIAAFVICLASLKEPWGGLLLGVVLCSDSLPVSSF